MIEIVLANVQFLIADIPGQPGQKVMQFIDQSGIRVSVPIDDAASQVLAEKLRGGIAVANGVLPPDMIRPKGRN